MDESWLIINVKCLGIGRWDIHKRSTSKWQMSQCHHRTQTKKKKPLRITSKWESKWLLCRIKFQFYNLKVSIDFSWVKSFPKVIYLFFCKGKNFKGRVLPTLICHWTQQLGWHFTSWQIQSLENYWYISVSPKTLWGTRKAHCKCWIVFFDS